MSKDKKIEIGQYWLLVNRKVIEIVSYTPTSSWPWVGLMYDSTDRYRTYTSEGFFNVKDKKSSSDLFIKITKKDNPEYFI